MIERPERGIAVSVTPMALQADSRAYRIACTLADSGFRSIVVEGWPSRNRFWDDRLEVLSLRRSVAESRSGSALRHGHLRSVVSALREGRFGSPGEAMLYAAFRAHDWRCHYHIPRARLPPADLYYLHSFEMHRAVMPIAARSGARIIYDAHDFYREIDPPEAQPSFDHNRLRPFYDRLESQLVTTADAVVTVSHGVANQMERVFGRRPAVIRNCHDDRRDRCGGADLRALLGLNPTDRLCVMIGNYKPGMAIGVAAAALALLPGNFHFAFIGRGYEAVTGTLPRELIASRLHLGNPFDPDEVVPAIRSADVGMVLYEPRSINYRNALPNGFFQVVAACLPLVRAPLVEVEKAIGDRRVGVCLDRPNPTALAGAIMHCSAAADASRTEAARLARELRWELEARRLADLLGDVMRERRTSPAAALTALGV
ncbi:MAG: glycosyltransferase [Alphaproteobacteria bacterium]|nr:glycosyltransferase [Alphaproteobacteria bacterium]